MGQHYEIQLRRGGEWQRRIGFRSGPYREAAERAWAAFCCVNRCAARFVSVNEDTNRVRVISTKGRTGHFTQRPDRANSASAL